MSSTVDALVEYGLSWKSTEHIADLRIGLGYTGVKLRSGKCGVACMLRHRLDRGTCSLLSQAGTLAGLEVSQAIRLARSQNVVEASIGLAVINALTDPDKKEDSSDTALVDLLQITREDRVGIVGYIGPIIREIKPWAKEMFIFDEAKHGLAGVTDLCQEAQILPRCDVAILSATSLLNHTFDSLLEMVSHAREICLMGPSTPLLPDFFRERGITLLAGRQITDADKILQIISEAGGTKRFRKVTRKVNIVVKKDNNR